MPHTNSILSLTPQQNCCGCSACLNVCPKACITMQSDAEGFLYPTVDQTSCVDCGLCEKVCPVLHPPEPHAALATYAAKHTSKKVRQASSSGGMFTALAQPVLEKGGVVFGAGFDKDWNVCHQSAETLKDLDKLRRSKYVQSNIGNTFQQAKNFLDQGRPVLFTGTPCQIAGLKNYLGKEYKNLLTADIICHGVPSPAVWRKFLDENFIHTKIKAINFRNKFFAWNKFYLSFQTNKGPRIHGDKRSLNEVFRSLFRKFSHTTYENAFLKAFLKDLILRPACHACAFKNNQHWSDFTMGDLWGAWPRSILSKQDQKLGISVLIIASEKGRSFFKQLSTGQYVSIPLEKVTTFNLPLKTSPQPHFNREIFFARYQQEPVQTLIVTLLE